DQATGPPLRGSGGAGARTQGVALGFGLVAPLAPQSPNRDFIVHRSSLFIPSRAACRELVLEAEEVEEVQLAAAVAIGVAPAASRGQEAGVLVVLLSRRPWRQRRVERLGECEELNLAGRGGVHDRHPPVAGGVTDRRARVERGGLRLIVDEMWR